MKRTFTVLMAVVGLACSAGVLLVRGSADRNEPVQLNPLPTPVASPSPLPQVSPERQPAWPPYSGPVVITPEMVAPEPSALTLAPDSPSLWLIAPPSRPRPEILPKEGGSAQPAFDPELLSACAPARAAEPALDVSKSFPPVRDDHRMPVIPRRDNDRNLDFVMLAEGFEGGAVPPWGWSRVVHDTNNPIYTWHIDTAAPAEGSYVAAIGWDVSLAQQDEWLISPTVNLSVGGPWTLSFWWMMSYQWAVSPYDNYDLELRISTNGGATWDPAVLWVEDNVGVFPSWVWQFASVDLSAYQSYSAVKFAWRYVGADGHAAYLDHIVLADCGAQPLPGDVIEAAEDPSDTSFYHTDPDGGCNSNPVRWGHISCGETVYGRSFTYLGPSSMNYRDTDWYLFQLTEPQWVRARVRARFPVTVFILSLTDTLCSGYTYAYSLGGPCDEVVVDVGCLTPGYHALWVGPSVFSGIRQPAAYRATLECGPCDDRSDLCENAVVINSLPFHETQTTAGYANNYDEVCPYSGSTSPDVVYRFTPDADMLVDVNLCPSEYDTKVYIYEGSCAHGTAIACNDDYGGCGTNGWRSRLDDVPLTRWHTYYFVIDGYGGEWGNYDLTITASGREDCPTNSMHSQPPTSSPPQALCSERNVEEAVQAYDVHYAITEIHFWGLMLQNIGGTWVNCQENPVPFVISMYTPQPAGSRHKLCEEYVTLNGVATGDSLGSYAIYHFSTPVSMSCQMGQGYLSIQAAGDTSCWFFWLMAPADGSPGGEVLVEDIWTPVAYDFSLCLVGDTVAMPECLVEDTCIVSQPPSRRGQAGIALSEDWTGYWCAQQFSADSQQITGIRFYGLSLSASAPCVENPMPFIIRFHEDSLGYPGSVVCAYTDTLLGRFTGHFYYMGGPLYEYSASFNSPCDLSEGWVSVVGTGENCQFWWLSSGVVPDDSGMSFMWIPTESRWDTVAWDQSMCLFGRRAFQPQCPLPDTTLFGQVPSSPYESWNAYLSDTVGVYQQIADDFTGLSEPVAAVDFWGIHIDGTMSDCDPAPMTVRVVFYQDAAGQPGAVVCSTSVVTSFEWTGLSWGTWEFYQHRAILPTPCTLANGWVSVVNASGPDCWFYWVTSGQLGSGNGHFRQGTGAWGNLGANLAFCLLRACGAAISGEVDYHESGLPVPGIVMDIMPGDSVLTDGGGVYTFSNLSAGESYSVVPGCNSAANCDAAISFMDASLTAQAAFGLVSWFDDHISRAADVSGNGRVTFYDASLIAQYAIGSISSFPCGCRWVFEPEGRSYSPLTGDQAAQDYVAICMGDVSTNWTGQPPPISTEIARAFEDAVKLDGSVVVGNITERSAFSMEFRCHFDAQELTFAGAELVEGLEGWYLYTREEPGVVHVGAFGISPMQTGRDIVLLHFDPVGGEPVPCRLAIEGYRVNDSPPLAAELAWGGPVLPREFALEQNFPNPFNATTRIRYSLPQRAHVTLTLYNSLGARVTVLVDEVQEAGFRTVTFDGSSLASGLYFYRLDAGDFHKIRKMALLK